MNELISESNRLRDISIELGYLADAFRITGNNEIYIQLNDISTTIDEIQQAIHDIAIKDNNE